jgi:glycosyltransferase involved in cell wall biosynthesis
MAGATIDAMHIKTSPLQRVPGIAHRYRGLLPLMPLAARSWNVGDADLVVSLSHCVAKAVRVPQRVPHVCYCFTPMRYAWDGREAYLDRWRRRPLRRWLAGCMLDKLRRYDRRTAAGVTHFVAISQTVRARIQACYGRASQVIYPPADVDYFTPARQARGPDYLVVSALVPYKRVEHAIAACAAAGRSIVVIGEGPERARLERDAGPHARFLGWQSDSVIRDHLRTCRALLFPGEEDFGIVPVEALACAAPVIAYGAGGAAETVTNDVGRLYPEPTAQCLAQTILAWERAGQPHDPAEARRRAEGFSRPRFRANLLAALADAVGRPDPSAAISGPHALATRPVASNRAPL